MLLLGRADLDRVPHLGRIHRMGDRGLPGEATGRAGRTVAGELVREPAERRADDEPARGDRVPRPARGRADPPEPLRDRFAEHRIVERVQRRVLLAVGRRARGVLGRLRELGLDRAPAFGVEPVVDVAVEVVFGELHLTTFNPGSAGAPVSIARRRSRPRKSRDITVPIGMPSASLTSA